MLDSLSELLHPYLSLNFDYEGLSFFSCYDVPTELQTFSSSFEDLYSNLLLGFLLSKNHFTQLSRSENSPDLVRIVLLVSTPVLSQT
jgi:hypothetical protein